MHTFIQLASSHNRKEKKVKISFWIRKHVKSKHEGKSWYGEWKQLTEIGNGRKVRFWNLIIYQSELNILSSSFTLKTLCMESLTTVFLRYLTTMGHKSQKLPKILPAILSYLDPVMHINKIVRLSKSMKWRYVMKGANKPTKRPSSQD